MKRPRMFYLVAAWCCLALLLHTSYLVRLAGTYQAAGEPVPGLWSILPLVAVGFLVWQTVGLVRLRLFNRWFAVVFLVWWAIALIWNATIILPRPTVKLFPAIGLFSVLVTVNLLSAWYLSRRTFREFSVQFVAERDEEKHSRMMQKVSQKKILDDLRS